MNETCKHCVQTQWWEPLPVSGLFNHGLIKEEKAFWCKAKGPRPDLALHVSSLEPGPGCDGILSGDFCSVGHDPAAQRACSGWEKIEE